jgi:urease accessory protein
LDNTMNYLLWQLIDSSFPSGGFAHSGGLEAAVQHGHVAGPESLRAFTRQTLAQGGRSALPLVTAAHRRPDELPDLDGLCDVFLSNPVANRASRVQGRALLTAVARSFPHPDIAALDAGARSDRLAAHLAPSFGAVYGTLGVGLLDAQRAFLFVALRGVSSAAVRLGLVGAYEAQEIQAWAAADIDEVIQVCAHLEPHDIAQTAPLIDLFQSTHDRLYSRLFQS